MKKVVVLAIAVLTGAAGYAQTTTRFGLKAGVSLPKYQFKQINATDPDTKTLTSFHVTGYVDAPVGSYFSVQPGISLQGKGGKLEGSGITSKQNTLWIEIPVNLVAKFPVAAGKGTSVYLGAGPYAAFGISGKNKVTGLISSESDVKFGNSSTDDIKGKDFGANFIAGFEMGGGTTLGAGYGMGISDLRPGGTGGNGKTTNRVWSFSLGMLF